MLRLQVLCIATNFAAGICVAEPQKVMIPSAHSDGVSLSGYFQPAAGGTGARAPAIVLMHGCGGPVTSTGRIRARERSWIERFAQAGYASLLVDSFNPRGVRSTCGRPTKGLSSHDDRPFDAYAGLRWLQARADIDGAKVALIGWSHGGETVLSTVSRTMADRVGGGSGAFVSAIAFYPGCSAAARVNYQPNAPLILMLGEKDDWTAPGPCIALGRAVGAEVNVFADSYHDFDNPVGVVRLRKDVPNGVNPGQGVHVGPNPVAREKAYARMLEALRMAFDSSTSELSRLSP